MICSGAAAFDYFTCPLIICSGTAAFDDLQQHRRFYVSCLFDYFTCPLIMCSGTAAFDYLQRHRRFSCVVFAKNFRMS